MTLRSLLFLFLAILTLFGCDSNTTKSSDTLTPSTESIYQREFDASYLRLSRIYYRSEELKSESEYIGHGNTGSDSFADVIYLYSALSDRFTRYFTPAEAQSTLAMYMGSGNGAAIVGLYSQIINDTLMIVRIIPNSPATEAGIRKGDKIIQVNGIDITGQNATSYSVNTEGGAGTEVVYTLLRGTEMLTCTVVKKVLKIPTVWLDSIDGVPVIQVDFFATRMPPDGAPGTAFEFRTLLAEAGNFESAIIDLRGNPGGSVEECLQMTDDLLDTGVIVYQIEHRYDSLLQKTVIDTNQPLLVTANSPFEKRHYVFLADAGSASCSEIMLAGVERNTDWPIVGRTSYGKGIAQVLWDTPAGGLEVITSIEYRDGNWSDYHHKGIAPSVPVDNADSALVTAVRLAKEDMAPQVALARKSVKQFNDRHAMDRINAHLKNRPNYPRGTWDFRNLKPIFRFTNPVHR